MGRLFERNKGESDLSPGNIEHTPRSRFPSGPRYQPSVKPPLSLFTKGDDEGPWQIKTEVLTKADWDTLAFILVESLSEPFSHVWGVSQGGVRLAEALLPYATACDRILVVDDVWETGGSMERFISESFRGSDMVIDRAVIFARRPTPSDVVVIFRVT